MVTISRSYPDSQVTVVTLCEPLPGVSESGFESGFATITEARALVDVFEGCQIPYLNVAQCQKRRSGSAPTISKATERIRLTISFLMEPC